MWEITLPTLFFYKLHDVYYYFDLSWLYCYVQENSGLYHRMIGTSTCLIDLKWFVAGTFSWWSLYLYNCGAYMPSSIMALSTNRQESVPLSFYRIIVNAHQQFRMLWWRMEYYVSWITIPLIIRWGKILFNYMFRDTLSRHTRDTQHSVSQ